MGYKPKAPDLMPDINVVPMADIMLVMLIIFMVITPMLQKGFSVEMAKTDNPRDMKDADKDDAVVLAVSRDGRYYLGNQQVLLEQVVEKVSEMLEERLDKSVYVKSDARARYGDVVKLVDEIRAVGVDQIGLLTEQRALTGPPIPVQAVTGATGGL